MLETEIRDALAPLTDTSRVVIVGIAPFDVALEVDGTDTLFIKIPFNLLPEGLLAYVLDKYPQLADILAAPKPAANKK